MALISNQSNGLNPEAQMNIEIVHTYNCHYMIVYCIFK
jgi:hypothetical protein